MATTKPPEWNRNIPEPAPPPLSDDEPITVIVGRDCPPAVPLDLCLGCRDRVCLRSGGGS
ncbi:hypothetical protein [Streptomyces sp. PT12]|uniref:hypothetical protein n=1 Tax=Streptomyces sp. PT12 TaxID=1510197 RepID=UPI0011BE3125|nr:hypothetical protein [Streptomyces sp. PT12]